MRAIASNKKISVQAVAGTHVVLLGLDATESARQGLLGFTIERTGGGKPITLGGGQVFEKKPAEKVNHFQRSDEAPIQAFMWSDYSALPGIRYTYTITPNYGKPDKLEPGERIEVTVSTERPDDGKHGVFFNRGVAGSQAYARRFGKYRRSYVGPGGWKSYIKPEDVPDRKAYEWLSRGLEEGMIQFLRQAKDAQYAIHASVYEFSYLPIVREFVAAAERGVDVKIVHHYKKKTTYTVKFDRDKKIIVKDDIRSNVEKTKEEDEEFRDRKILVSKEPDAVGEATHKTFFKTGLRSNDGLGDDELEKNFRKTLIPRTHPAISHNKFIILLKDGEPIRVWTGSTNFTAGGIFGQSNVGHHIRDKATAKAYHNYWLQLKKDPENKEIRDWTVSQGGPEQLKDLPQGITPVFSPRSNEEVLQWYADQIKEAKSSVHLTSAFTISKPFLERLTDNAAPDDDPDTPYLRYVLLEGNGGLLRDKVPQIRKVPLNRVAWGDVLKRHEDTEELTESLTGLNSHVNFLHTKYMLIDPLTDDPIIITGSANFSSASTTKNDENMVVIRGNTRVADIFIGEFMRLFNHFRVRNEMNEGLTKNEHDHFLEPNDSWTKPYFDQGSSLYQERLLFRADPEQLNKPVAAERGLDMAPPELDLDYYMFDWDDNILFMPTRIHLEKDGHPVSVTTKEFAEIRQDSSYTIPADAFREFRDGTGDFVCDSRVAIAGRRYAPSYYAFKRALREARLFCIVTARGHSSATLRKGVEAFIREAMTEEERLEMMSNIQVYNEMAGLDIAEENRLTAYLDLNAYIGVSSPGFLRAYQASGAVSDDDQAAASPEEKKTYAVEEFVQHTLQLADKLPYQTRSVSFGFSDDDKGNLSEMREFIADELKKKYSQVTFFVYDTSGTKTEIEKL